MKLEQFYDYATSLQSQGLTKIEMTSEMDEAGHYYVIKTKETYTFAEEDEADAKINDARQDSGFAAAEKKFKAGKINKSGEITRPDTWTVVIKLNH